MGTASGCCRSGFKSLPSSRKHSWGCANLVRPGWGRKLLGMTTQFQNTGSCHLLSNYRVPSTFLGVFLLLSCKSLSSLLSERCSPVLQMRKLSSERLVTRGPIVSDEPNLSACLPETCAPSRSHNVAAHRLCTADGHVLFVTR